MIGIGRSVGSDHELRDSLAEFVEDKAAFDWLRERVTYLKGRLHPGDALFDQLKAIELKDAVFYLATAASFFGPIVDKLADGRPARRGRTASAAW